MLIKTTIWFTSTQVSIRKRNTPLKRGQLCSLNYKICRKRMTNPILYMHTRIQPIVWNCMSGVSWKIGYSWYAQSMELQRKHGVTKEMVVRQSFGGAIMTTEPTAPVLQKLGGGSMNATKVTWMGLIGIMVRFHTPSERGITWYSCWTPSYHIKSMIMEFRRNWI